MEGFELYDLGRKLMQIGEDALPDPTDPPRPSPRKVYVITDVFEYRDTVTTNRTAGPADQVAASVATLSDLDARTTGEDPGADVRPNAGTRVDERLAAAAGLKDPAQAQEVLAALEILARGLAGHSSPEQAD